MPANAGSLQSARAQDVPFCAAATMATAVVLARCSAPERVRSATLTALAAERCSVSSATGTHTYVLAIITAPV